MPHANADYHTNAHANTYAATHKHTDNYADAHCAANPDVERRYLPVYHAGQQHVPGSNFNEYFC